MSGENVLYIHKEIKIDDTVIYNIIVDGLLSFGYGTLAARKLADKVIEGGLVHDNVSGTNITKKKILDSMRRIITAYDYEVEYISDSGREVLVSII